MECELKTNYCNNHTNKKLGKIIILNGVSSSGKTTLAMELQEQSEVLLFRISVDDFCNMIPQKAMCIDTFNYAIEMMLRTIRSFSERGFSVVVDIVILKSLGTWDILLEHLHDLPLLLVHVHCPIDELRRREIQRGDRKIGQGERQLDDLFPQEQYDLHIDTYKYSISDCAKQILTVFNR